MRPRIEDGARVVYTMNEVWVSTQAGHYESCQPSGVALEFREYRAVAPRNAAFLNRAIELIDKVRYYLLHDYERERIRQAENSRTMSAGHSYRNRLEQILQAASPQPKLIQLRV